MKKIFLTLAIAFGLSICANAQYSGGLFQYGPNYQEDYSNNRETGLILPQHGQSNDSDAAPLSGGVLLLLGFGAAYALGKKKDNQQ